MNARTSEIRQAPVSHTGTTRLPIPDLVCSKKLI